LAPLREPFPRKKIFSRQGRKVSKGKKKKDKLKAMIKKS